MKPYKIIFPFFAAFMLIACNKVGLPGENGDIPSGGQLPGGISGSTYSFSTIKYDDALADDNDDELADKSDTDIYWEAEAESDGTFKNTITIAYDGDDAVVTMNKKAAEVFKAEKSGAHVVILPSGDDVKKCEIILSGSSDDGSLKIYCATDPDDKETGKKVKLTLNGLSLKSKCGPAINYQAGKRMYLHLADGTDNCLEDSSTYSDDFFYFDGKTAADEDRKGCFFSEKAVIVSGKGRLYVQGNYRHGISVDNDFYMRPGPTVVVTGAAKNCLHCNDEIRFTGGYFYANNTSAGGKGVKTDSTLIVDGGRLVVNTSGAYDAEETSPKGFKIDGDITVNGGSITIRCTGKCEGSEGFESKSQITINGGTLDIMAYDDAMNAATLITVNDGEVSCLSTNNDGIDSNGSIIINGGSVTSFAANMEAALDNDNPGSNDLFEINGGNVIGIGGTAYSPSSSSKQCSIVYNGCPVSTTEEMTIKDAEGNTLLSCTSYLGSQNAGVILSSPEFKNGSSYTLNFGTTTYNTIKLTGKVTTIGTSNGMGGGGGFGPGGPGR